MSTRICRSILMDTRWIVFLIIATTLGHALECKDDGVCSCQMSHNGDFEIFCPTSNQSAFVVDIQPSKYIHVLCRNTPSWADFRLRGEFAAKSVESMYFRMCSELPTNFSLGWIAQRLGAETVYSLLFQSYKNLSSTLKRQHLEGLASLKKLILSSNNLSNLTQDLLHDVPELIWLDLRENNIHRLAPGMFNSTPNLEVLELGNNMMNSLEPSTFDGLGKLRLLNLWKNSITELKPGTFDKLVSLKSLDINTNMLTNLTDNIFEKLDKLETLNLFGNNFSSLPENLLRNNKHLKAVNLSNNKRNMTTLPNGFFRDLTELKVVKLKRNGLQTLPEDLFWGATLLTNVSIERNYLVTLPGSIFRDSTQLRMLDLSFNDIKSLPDFIFANASQLIKLNLSKNHISSISRYMFDGLKSLEELNMEQNELKTVHDLSFISMENLRIVKFMDNQLTLMSSLFHYQDEFGIKSPFHACTSLEELHLAKNNISEIFSDWIVSSLKLRILDLRYNNLQSISADDLQFVSNNIKVNLSYNNISQVLLTGAERVASLQQTPRDVIISLDHNPIRCDCLLYDFLRYLEGRMHPYVQNYFHIIPGNLTCHNPWWLEDMPIANLKSTTLKCIVNQFSTNTKCPEQCTCWARPEDNAYLVDCSFRNLTHVPNNITTTQERIELNFTGNLLTEIPSMAKLGLERVSTLLLSYNDISRISLNDLPATLEVLELHNNNLTSIDQSVLEFMKNSTSLTKLTLHGNPWRCDCDSRDFLTFLQTKFVDMPDLLKVTCKNMNTSMTEMTASELCPVETVTIVGISLAIAMMGLIIGAIAALYYRYQQEIKVWLYAHQWCLWFVTEDELDKDKLYDAFISYSHKDEDFVVNQLVHNLENGPRPFKLCLHFRDWLAGEWIPTQIARSVEDSRRTIVILSPNFLESVWGRMEFRAAHSQALSEGRARVILILYGEIGPTDDLDPELKAYLSMNTYVKWGDPWFWDKLRYALPHPPEFTKRSMSKKIFEKHHPHIQLNGEKKELIHPPGVPETPPAVTTPPADALKIFICDENPKKEELATNECRNGSVKLNGSIKHTLTLNHELAKNHSKTNIMQCTTV